MRTMWDYVQDGAAILVLVVVSVWILYRWLKSSEDPRELVLYWVLTAADLAYLYFLVGPVVARGDMIAAFAGIPMAAVGGLVLAAIWTSSLTGVFGRAVGQIYDGGAVAPDPEPFFSIAEAKRKRGQYHEAAQEAAKQIERFPTSFKAHMFLAEIQAQDLHDLAAAEATVEQLVSQPGHAPKNIAFALTWLADWHLRLRKDIDKARSLFERIVATCPDSVEAHYAQQRIAHLNPNLPAAGASPPPLPLPQCEPRLGLRSSPPDFLKPQKDPGTLANELVRQLEKYPFDNQAREELAILYAREFQRLDLATDQIEQLIAQPNAPVQSVIHWINLLADLQVQESGNAEAATRTLSRIIERFPDSPAAQVASRRLATITVETRRKKESQVVQLGSYEQNLGLKSKD